MKAPERLRAIQKSQVMEAINNLTDMALENRKLLHIFVNITPHINEVSVSVYPKNHDWAQSDASKQLHFGSVKLDSKDTLLKLLEIEDQLIDLIVDTKEQCETEVAA